MWLRHCRVPESAARHGSVRRLGRWSSGGEDAEEPESGRRSSGEEPGTTGNLNVKAAVAVPVAVNVSQVRHSDPLPVNVTVTASHDSESRSRPCQLDRDSHNINLKGL